MKTTSFSTIELTALEGGLVVMEVSAPGHKPMEIDMSPDELMMLIVELSNTLSLGRVEERKDREKRDLDKESKRC